MAQELTPGLPGKPISAAAPRQLVQEEQITAGGAGPAKQVYLTMPQFRQVFPNAPKNAAEAFVPHLNDTLALYDITTKERIAMFLGQVGHESGEFRYVREIASGSAYEGREDLGNTQPGDGRRFKGRGLIQVTGRANYLACGKELGLDLIKHPELLETPHYACLSAGWYWSTRKLNKWADAGNLKEVTKRINGGFNGLEHRKELYARAIAVL